MNIIGEFKVLEEQGVVSKIEFTKFLDQIPSKLEEKVKVYINENEDSVDILDNKVHLIPTTDNILENYPMINIQGIYFEPEKVFIEFDEKHKNEFLPNSIYYLLGI